MIKLTSNDKKIMEVTCRKWASPMVSFDDLVSECYLRFYSYLQHKDVDFQTRDAFMFRFFTNTCLTFIRKEKRHQCYAFNDEHAMDNVVQTHSESRPAGFVKKPRSITKENVILFCEEGEEIRDFSPVRNAEPLMDVCQEIVCSVDMQRFIEAKTTPDERKLLIMLADGETYEDIAAEFRIPIGTVRSRINRVRNRLQSDSQLKEIAGVC